MDALTLPLVAAFLAFLCGVLPGLRFGGPPVVFAIFAGAGLVAIAAAPGMLGRKLEANAIHKLLLASLVLAGVGMGAQSRADAAADCRATLADGANLTLRGALAADLLPTRGPGGKVPTLPVRVEDIRTQRSPVARCEGELRVSLPRGTRAMRAGTVLEIRGEWAKMQAPVVPSAWPRDPAYAGLIFAREVRVREPPSLVRHPLLVMRGAVEAELHQLFGRNGPLADALLLGRRETLDAGLKQRFAQSGLVHLLAISGGHVALIAAVLLVLGRVARVPRRAGVWLAIGLVAVYLAVIGAPASAVRSGIMVALALLSVLLQRPAAKLPMVCAAALIILAADPMAALDAGFQLSFAGVLGILLLRGAMLAQIPKSWRKGKIRRPLVESLVVSVAAFLATAPVVASQFGQVAPISILANLPAIPLTSLALVGVGAAALLEPVCPPLARLLADGTGVALDLLNRVVDLAAAVPWGHAEVSPPQWPLWAAVALVCLLSLDLAGALRPRVRWAVALSAACSAFLAFPVFASGADDGLELDFIDVGQGDAIALRTPAGRWILVDAGPRDERMDAGEKRVLPFLRARGVERLEAIVLTHPHADHIGGAPAVMRALPVGRLIEPGLAVGSPLYLETLETAQEHGVVWTAARQGRTLTVDGVRLDFVWPAAETLDVATDANEISAVIHLRYGSFTALLTGDAEAPAEHEMVRRYGAGLRSQVLKSGHHGSSTSSSEELLDAVRPDLAVISAGLRNRYGHPDRVILDRYARRGIAVARTDRGGTVTVRVPGDGTHGYTREGG
jgi:competence protein ComEC